MLGHDRAQWARQQYSLNPEPLASGDDFWKPDDFEGIVLDRSGSLYAITSHSRDSDGDEKNPRDKLVRF